MAGAAPGAERNAQARRGRSTAQRGTAATCRHRRAAPRFLPPPSAPGAFGPTPSTRTERRSGALRAAASCLWKSTPFEYKGQDRV